MVNDITVEAKRVLKEDGIAYHAIGLHDHYTSVSKQLSKVNSEQKLARQRLSVLELTEACSSGERRQIC